MSEVDDDVPQLSAETFAALQEFYKEQAQKEEKLKLGLTQSSEDAIPIDEDWVIIVDLYSKICNIVV